MMTLYSRGEETQNTILHAALELFSQDGYDATSVADICAKAKVSKGAFYHHFPTKQELFLALMTTWLEKVDGFFQTAGESALDVPEALETMAGVTGGMFDALEGGFPILLEFWKQASHHPDIWQQAVAPYHNYLDFFSGVVQAGVDAGDFDANLEPAQTARILMAVAMGLLLQASFDPQGANWQEVTQTGIKMILSGMRRLE